MEPTLTQAEIADRITILELKDKHRVIAACSEVEYLKSHCYAPPELLDELREANAAGWDSKQALADHFDGDKKLSEHELAVVIEGGYAAGKRRARIKYQIWLHTGGPLEAKSWVFALA